MRKLALIVAVALLPSLGACAQFQAVRDSLSLVGTAQLTPKDVLVAVKSFNLLEGLATKYLTLPRCNGTTNVCRSPTVTAQVIPAVRKGRIARNTLITFQRAHPGQLGPQGAFDALTASIATLKQIIANNTGATL